MNFGSKRRVAVAKDVLKQLRTKKYIAMTGVYISFDNIKDERDSEGDVIDVFEEGVYANKDLQEILPELICTVCAKGAILASRVNLFNECELDKDIDFDNEAGEVAEEVFGLKQATLIEAAFEGWDACNADVTREEGIKCKALIAKYPKSLNRMRVIMNNIVRNKGVFKP